MGLDMYAYTIHADMIEDQQVDFRDTLEESREIDPSTVNLNFAYWRKFNHLHGWMETLYYAKGGKDDCFNGSTVRLMPEDIDKLEAAMKENKLIPTKGFFFGSEELYPEDVESLEEFINDCREAFKDGLAVIYDSWW